MQRNTGYFPTESLEPCGNRLFSRSALNEGYLFRGSLKKGYDYLLPIFTFGKYYEEGGKYYIPLSIQVHHAVCDGFHVCRFLDELQDLLNK